MLQTFLAALLLPVLILHNRLNKTPEKGYMTWEYFRMHREFQLKLLKQYRLPLCILLLLCVGSLLIVFR